MMRRPAFKGVAHFDTHASGGVEGRAAMRCGGVGTQRGKLSTTIEYSENNKL